MREYNNGDPILIVLPNHTITPDEPDDADYITVDTEEEKEYLEYLRNKEKYSVKGLRTKLSGIREYQEWTHKK